MNYLELDTPSLVIKKNTVEENIKFMQDLANINNVNLRPHTKTHKMPKIAKLQLSNGAIGIAVAKIGEAEVMCDNGINDIFIANEIIGKQKFQRIAALSKSNYISFGVDNPIQVIQANDVFKSFNQTANVLVEIEVGENRSGIIEKKDFIQLLNVIKKSTNITFKGIFSHDGNSYSAKNIESCIDISINAQKRTLEFSHIAKEMDMVCEVVSYGSTPTLFNKCPILDGITEIRPGTYIFMDASQANSVNDISRCAAMVLASVISKPTKSRVILDVGAKGLTMQERTLGICKTIGKGTLFNYPNTYIEKVFDEHAIINNEEFSKQINIGDKVLIIPVHICPVCNLYEKAYLIDQNEVVDEIDIACRAKLQ
ncbi:MAG: alanine racemase [Pleomorphochaeta sp.]